MRLGLTMFATDRSMPVHELARAAEERGFSSLFLPEHTHIPVSRRTPPANGDAELAEEYKRTLDPLVALSFAAAVTERLRLGTGILLAAQREPIVTAKALATLDRLSGGRVVVGVGFGWNVEEIANHGVPYRARREVARRNVLAMQALWRDERGRGVRRLRAVLVVAQADLRRRPCTSAARRGRSCSRTSPSTPTGWMPIGGKGIRTALPALREACEKAGRPMARVVPFGTLPTREKLDYLAELGIEEAVLALASAPTDAALRQLDAYARFV